VRGRANDLAGSSDTPQWRPSCVLALLWVVFAGADHALAEPSDAAFNQRLFEVSDGLSQSQVRVIHQDVDGYLWAGTQAGLARFNGRVFKRFTSADGLAGNQIEAITSDPSIPGVWFGTHVGLCRYLDGRFDCRRDEFLHRRSVDALAIANGWLWIGTRQGLARLRPDDPDSFELLISGQQVRALAYDPHAELMWVGSNSGLHKVDLDTTSIEAVPLVSDRAATGEEPAVSALLAARGALWIGTQSGLFARDSVGRARHLRAAGPLLEDTTVSGLAIGPDQSILVATYRGLFQCRNIDAQCLEPVEGFEETIVRTLLADHEGTVWAGLDTGLLRLAPSRFVGYSVADGLLSDFVRTLALDGSGRMWLGTRIGIQVVPLQDGRLRLDESFVLTRSNGLPNDRIYDIAFTSGNDALIASNGGLLMWREGEGVVRTWTTDHGLPANHVRSLRVDGRGRIWVGTVAGVAVIEDNQVSSPVSRDLAAAYAFDMHRDEAGTSWFATRDDGLLRLTGDGAVKRLGADQGLTDQTLWDLAPAAGGGLWVGSNGDGLFRVAPDGTVVMRLTEAEGLANDFIWSVLDGGPGGVWAYTTRGLSRYDGERIMNFDTSHGLLHLEGGATGALVDRDGYFWFASVGGLVRYTTDDASPSEPPRIVIEAVSSGQRSLAPGAGLPYRHEDVTIEYAALSFQDPESIQYRYRLAGLNADWTRLSAYRPLTFAHLPPGNYRFEVVAIRPEGRESLAPATFSFRVLAPVWNRPWFVALTVLLVGGLVVLGVMLRLRVMARQKQRLSELVSERTSALEMANLQLSRAATSDPLTGLKNRRYLNESIERDIALCRRSYHAGTEPENAGLAFLVIDLDRFKEINDHFGHQAGDKALQQIAGRLLDVARGSDDVIRWGGDEFLIVARQAAPAAGRALAERVLRMLRTTHLSLDDQNQVASPGASIGICCYPFSPAVPDALSWEQIVEIADEASYLAKRNGRGCWVEIGPAGNGAAIDSSDFVQRVRADAIQMRVDGQIRILSNCPDLERND